MEDLINIVHNIECIQGMRTIPDNSIDMICTDPPYFLDGLGDTWNKEGLDKRGNSSVVGNLPKGMKFDKKQSKNFHDFYVQVSIEAYRILKPGGAFLSFSSPRLYHAMATAIEENGFEIRDMLGWVYTKSQVKAFSQNHIIEKDKTRTPDEKCTLKEKCTDWRTPQLKPAIEPICFAVKPIEGRYIDNFDTYGTGLMNTSKETSVGSNGTHFPSNILTTETFDNDEINQFFFIPKPDKKEKKAYNTHLSVKPVELIGQLVKLFTKKNGIVVDPFMGSGTLALACTLNDRRFIGFEINKEYIDITNRRLLDSA